MEGMGSASLPLGGGHVDWIAVDNNVASHLCKRMASALPFNATTLAKEINRVNPIWLMTFFVTLAAADHLVSYLYMDSIVR